MKKYISVRTMFLVTLFLSQSSIGAEKWINIAESKSNIWAVKPNSVNFSKNKADEPIIVVIGRVTDKKTLQIDLNQWYVTGYDCGREMGKVVSLDINGNFLYENDFVFGSGTVATVMAETICGVAKYLLNKENEKGL